MGIGGRRRKREKRGEGGRGERREGGTFRSNGNRRGGGVEGELKLLDMGREG